MKKKTPLAQGYILEETENTVVIATGFLRPSQNTGTGPMIQVYILYRHSNPVPTRERNQCLGLLRTWQLSLPAQVGVPQGIPR